MEQGAVRVQRITQAFGQAGWNGRRLRCSIQCHARNHGLQLYHVSLHYPLLAVSQKHFLSKV